MYALQGTLRDQLLYPKLLRRLWDSEGVSSASHADCDEASRLLAHDSLASPMDDTPLPSDEVLIELLNTLGLSHLITRDTVDTACVESPEETVLTPAAPGTRDHGLDAVRNWKADLSVGEQQRIAFARLLCHRCVSCRFVVR